MNKFNLGLFLTQSYQILEYIANKSSFIAFMVVFSLWQNESPYFSIGWKTEALTGVRKLRTFLIFGLILIQSTFSAFKIYIQSLPWESNP